MDQQVEVEASELPLQDRIQLFEPSRPPTAAEEQRQQEAAVHASLADLEVKKQMDQKFEDDLAMAKRESQECGKGQVATEIEDNNHAKIQFLQDKVLY